MAEAKEAPVPTSDNGLHNRYRPQTFDQLIGNVSAVTQLRGMLKKKLPSAILFTGPASVGKTTMARALVNEVNGADNFNVNCAEVNFGTDRTIDDIRDLIRVSKLRPAQGAKRRFILGDEAQQILGNSPAANALLKPLEEPVSTTTFLLCSMEPDRFASSSVGRAILTRCVNIKLTVPDAADMRKQALRIIRGEKMREHIDPETLDVVIESSNCSMRVLANQLEALFNFHAGLDKPRILTPDDVSTALGMASGNDDVLAVRMMTAVYDRKYVAAHREILDVGDSFGFINKCLWLNWFVLNQLVLKGARHPKVWGNTNSYELVKQSKAVFENGNVTREQQVTIVSDVMQALTSLKMGAGAFAVDEKMAISTAMWTLISNLKIKIK